MHLDTLSSKLDEANYKKLKALKNVKLLEFIADSCKLCNPDGIFICNDSYEDIEYIRQQALVNGEEKELATPGHTYHFDGIYDLGRDRKATKFLVPKGEFLSPALNQIEREQGLAEVRALLKDSMKGRVMIVRFLTLGPANSPFTIYCVECTDSWYVAHSVSLLYRAGYKAIAEMEDEGVELFFTLHSAGKLNQEMVSVDYDKKCIYIDYLENVVYSVNTQYAGNSIGFKKLALRLAIRKAHREGWLAEHFMMMGVVGPGGRKTYLAGAFPSACGKTSTAMLPGETILADDISYVRNIDGVARAVNVEAGIFGIIQDVNPKDDPQIYKVLTKEGEIIFSNLLVKDGVPYWLGMGMELPSSGVNYSGSWWKGKRDEGGEEIPPAHKNARYTVALKALENCDPNLDNPMGVELGGIMYGGRDYRAYPPVQEGFSWEHGIIAYGAALETETTFALVEEEGKYEINIMSIQDFVSISLGEYLSNYLKFGENLKKVPRVFGANYFLLDLKRGRFLNDRRDKHVWVKWMELRVHNDVEAIETPIGLIPRWEDLRELFNKVLQKEYPREDYIKQFTIRVNENLAKVERVERFYREKVKDAPDTLFRILLEQRERLVKAKGRFGDYISPECF